MTDVYESIAAALDRHGVDRLFGLMGMSNIALIEAMADRHGARYYGARHETGAVSMADAWARVSGRPGVCTVTQGPGLTNAITGLTEAVRSRSQVLLIVGDTGDPHHPQGLVQGPVVRSVGAGFMGVRRADQAARAVDDALREVRVQRRPVVLSVPTDLDRAARAPESSAVERPAAVVSRPRPDDDALDRVVGLLAGARRPLVLAGQGAVRSGARPELEELAGRVGALLASTAMAHGFFSGHAFDVGMSGGFATPLAAELIGEADVVLGFGASLNNWTLAHGTLLADDATLVHCDIDAASIGAINPVDYALTGDAAATATALNRALEAAGVSGEGFHSRELADRIAGYDPLGDFEDTSSPERIDPRVALIHLERQLPRKRNVTVDSGHFMGFACTYLAPDEGHAYVFSQAFLSLGLGIASGIGAAVARPDALTVAVLGDGGTLMSIGELDTAIRYELPILFVIINDAAYGAELHHMELMGVPSERAAFDDRDFAAVARAMGAEGLTVRSTADLDKVTPWLTDPQGPMVVDCKVTTVRGDWFEEAVKAIHGH